MGIPGITPDRLAPGLKDLSPDERAAYLLKRQNRRARSDSAVAHLETALGGREAIVRVLQFIPPDDPAYPLASLVCSDDHLETPLGQLCRSRKVAPRDLLVAWNRATELMAQAQVAHIAARHVAPVAEDVMTRAAPHFAQCGVCQGTGQEFRDPQDPAAKPPSTCAQCRGTGKVYVLPDLARQKAALELAKVASTVPGVSIQNDNRRQLAFTAVLPNADAFTKLQTAVDRITREPRTYTPQAADPPIDAEPVTDPAPEVYPPEA